MDTDEINGNEILVGGDNFQMGQVVRKCLVPYANNKGADQPAHPRSLISALVVRSLDTIISLVSRSELSRL